MLNGISLRAARVNAGLSQKEMAKRMDRSQNTVCAWERGDKIPRVDELNLYCSICGCETSDIILPALLEKSE